jgi:type 1 glutamine amidotransferase
MLAPPGPQNQVPKPSDVEKMEAALPSSAPAKPAHPRRVLVLSKAAGYVHSCIPLAAKTVQELGDKTGAWTTTITYDSADITADNVKQYDLIFLNNTTGAFLDDPDASVTAARKKALLEFVRSGKGLAGIHAASDSYHKAESSLDQTPGHKGPDPQVGTWPEFNTMIGGYFKWHWLDPTHIVYKIDDPKSPLTAMFRGGPFSVDDETYTFGIRSWSRKNLHILSSIDYSQMSSADKAKEDYPRPDHDYGLSWIRREDKGRVFYMAHGHDERIYAMKPMLEHLLAGIQYALGDLPADDSPSQ